MITLITTSYNYSEYISETIKSVLAQTYSDWELIIVDDASSDNSVDIIKQYTNDKRIKLICHDKNKGLKTAIKTGLKYAKGEWIAFLESDDTFEPDALEKRMASPFNSAKIIFNGVNLIGDSDWVEATKNQVEQTEKMLSKLDFPTNMFNNFVSSNPILTLSSVMIKKELFDKNIFNSPVDALLDWWIYIHICYKNETFYISEKLTNWRIHDKSYIKKPHRCRFCLVNTLAYFDVFKQNPSWINFKIVLTSLFKMLLIRLKVYFIGFVRLIKKILGIKTKKSPIFD